MTGLAGQFWLLVSALRHAFNYPGKWIGKIWPWLFFRQARIQVTFSNVAKWQKNKKSAYIFSKYLLRLIWKESGSNNNLSSEEHLKKIEIKYMIIIIIIFISFHHHH